MVTSTENDILERHEELKADLATKIDCQAWWAAAVESPHMQKPLNAIRDTIQRNRVSLEDAKSEEIKTLQAQISARKELLALIEANKSFTPVTDARQRLEEYEKQNALFINQKSEKAKR